MGCWTGRSDGFCATQNAIDVLGRVMILIFEIDSVRDKPTRIDETRRRVNCRQAMPQCQRNDEILIHIGHGMREDNKAHCSPSLRMR